MSYHLSVDVDGVSHSGSYEIEGKMIVVKHPIYGQEATQIGGMPADVLAKKLLLELVRKGMESGQEG